MPASPGPGVPYTVASTALGIASCDTPITDGHGEWIGLSVDLHYYGYRFVNAAAPETPAGDLYVPKTLYDGFSIAPQSDGYLAVTAKEFPGGLRRYDAQGNLLSDDHASTDWTIAGMPGGGAVLSTVENLRSANAVFRIVWTDAAGAQTAETVMPPGGVDPWFVVSARGEVLVLYAGKARWFDRGGAPLTGWFSYGPDARTTWSAGQVMQGSASLADGSVVVGLGTSRVLDFQPGAAQASAPPDWVTSRAGATIAAVRGNAANAFATVTKSASGCDVAIEILTSDGQSCGTTHLQAQMPCDRVSFGADRTVFTTGEDDAKGICSWSWWTGLLR